MRVHPGFTTCLMAGLLMLLAIPLYGADTPTVPVRDLVERALRRNAGLEQLKQKVRSARRDIDPSGSLDDPRLQAGAMNLPTDNLSFDDHPMTSKDLGLMQMVPYPGKLDRKEKRARAQYRAVKAEWFLQRTELIHQVRSTYYDWWAIRQIRKVAREERGQLDRLLSIARSRYETGEGIQADFERAATRISRLKNRLLKLEQRERERRERLRRLQSYRGETVPYIPVTVEPDTDVDPRSALHRIEETSPVLRRDTELVMAARQGVRLAELDYYPDVDFGLRYRQREDRDDFVSFSVSVPLPIWSSRKQTPRFESRQHQLEAMRSRYRDDRDELQYAFDDAVYRLRRIRRQLKLYENQLLPEAKRTMQSTLASYRVGRVEFASVLDADLELFRVREERIQLVADHERTLSDLARIVGYERKEDLR